MGKRASPIGDASRSFISGHNIPINSDSGGPFVGGGNGLTRGRFLGGGGSDLPRGGSNHPLRGGDSGHPIDQIPRSYVVGPT